MNTIAINVDTLFLNHRDSLIHTIFRIVGCPQTAEDLAQEAYIKMVQAAATQEIAFPRPFLYQIARNLALDYLRKQQIRQSIQPPEADEGHSDQLLESLPAATPTPEQQTSDRQQLALMLAALSDLPERRRQILVLHKFHQWSYERIARHYGISRSAVEKNIYAALAHLLASQNPPPR